MTLTALPVSLLGDLYPEDVTTSILSEGTAPTSLPSIQTWQTAGPILQKNPFANNPDIQAVNYLGGCAHQCTFCPTRQQHNNDGRPIIRLVSNAAERLHAELANTFQPPQAVYLCPDSDPFPPLLAVQEETARIVDVLASHRIQAWLMTRGFIRPLALDVLTRHKDHVKVMLGLTTLDRTLQRVLEPLSAPPRLRLKQMRQLRRLGVPVQAALEPLVPGLTDTRENLLAVLEALADVGIKRVTTGYLFLPPDSHEKLQQQLRPTGRDALVLDAYADGFDRRMGEMGRVRFLSRARRQQGYALLMALAARFGITVSINSLSNPDFARPEPQKVATQRYLPGLWQPEKVPVG